MANPQFLRLTRHITAVLVYWTLLSGIAPLTMTLPFKTNQPTLSTQFFSSFPFLLLAIHSVPHPFLSFTCSSFFFPPNHLQLLSTTSQQLPKCSMRLLSPFFIVPLAVVSAFPALQTVDDEKRSVNVGWPYGTNKIRGVNIGGVSLSTFSLHKATC